jgi:hypothetical protein
MEGYYGHFTLSSTFHSHAKLFCQTFLQKGFSFTRKSASAAQPQLKLPYSQPEPCQTHPKENASLEEKIRLTMQIRRSNPTTFPEQMRR